MSAGCDEVMRIHRPVPPDLHLSDLRGTSSPAKDTNHFEVLVEIADTEAGSFRPLIP